MGKPRKNFPVEGEHEELPFADKNLIFPTRCSAATHMMCIDLRLRFRRHSFKLLTPHWQDRYGRLQIHTGKKEDRRLPATLAAHLELCGIKLSDVQASRSVPDRFGDIWRKMTFADFASEQVLMQMRVGSVQTCYRCREKLDLHGCNEEVSSPDGLF